MDRDTMFCASFRGILETAGVEALRLPPRSPICRHTSRDSCGECLSRLILFGERSLCNAVGEYVDYHFHRERNHQGLDNRIIHPEEDLGTTVGDVKCRERLGGLLRYYHRPAA